MKRPLLDIAVFGQSIKRHKLVSLFYVAIVILSGIPLIILLVLLVHYSVNTPFWDQLSFVDLMNRLHNGTFSLYNLWQQHNEHRIFVPQALELIVGKATDFNFRVPVFLNFITACGSLSFLILMLKKTFRNPRLVGLLAVPFAWLLFSPIQWTNWIWGFQLAFFLSVFFTIVTIWLIVKRIFLVKNNLFILGLILATITTYSNGNGLLIWPIGLAIILWHKADLKHVTAWSITGLIVICSYLYKFHRSPESLPLSAIIKEPAAVIKYALAYLGRNLALTPSTARYVGAVLVVVLVVSAVYIFIKGQLDNILPWVGLGLYAFLTALLAAISRLNFGIDHAFLSNSYPTISVIFILSTIAISVYALTILLRTFSKRKISLYVTLLIVFGALISLPLPAFFKNYASGINNLKGFSGHLHKVQTCIYEAKSENDDCLLYIFPNKKEAWANIQILRGLHWGNF